MHALSALKLPKQLLHWGQRLVRCFVLYMWPVTLYHYFRTIYSRRHLQAWMWSNRTLYGITTKMCLNTGKRDELVHWISDAAGQMNDANVLHKVTFHGQMGLNVQPKWRSILNIRLNYTWIILKLPTKLNYTCSNYLECEMFKAP